MPVPTGVPPIYGEKRLFFVAIEPQVIPNTPEFSTISLDLSTGLGRFQGLFWSLLQHIYGQPAGAIPFLGLQYGRLGGAQMALIGR